MSEDTATKLGIEIDYKKNKARQQAIQLVHTLRDHIATSAMRDAEYTLYELFYKYDVEITTAEQRHVTKVLGHE